MSHLGSSSSTTAVLVELTRPEAWPVLDPAAYHGLAGDFVMALEPHTEADPVGLLIQFLIMFGSMVGNSAYYQVESDKHHTVLFAVLVGDSAKGRKGTSAGRVNEVARGADQGWANERVVSGLSSGEGLIYNIRDAVVRSNGDDDEEISDPGIVDKRLMVTEPEFAGALASMERYGNTLSPVLRNAWDGKRLQTLTKNNPTKATDPHVSVIGHITRDELRARLTKTELANGFANRFLFCLVRRARLLPHGGHLDDAVLPALSEQLKEAVEVAKKIGRVKMTAEAAEAWTKTYPELSADRPGLLGAVTARAEAQVIRLALIYALLDCRNGTEIVEVDIPHLSAAMAAWAYCDQSAVLIFGESLGDPIADDIWTALRRSPAGLTRTEIYQLLGRHQSAAQISTALAMLSSIGRAICRTEQTAGRSAERWFSTGEKR